MSDEPDTPEEEEAWSFIPIENFLADVDKGLSRDVMERELHRLCSLHQCDPDAMLRRCLLLLKIVVVTMPVDAAQGLDAVRADPSQRVALPSLRDMISHLIDFHPE